MLFFKGGFEKKVARSSDIKIYCEEYFRYDSEIGLQEGSLYII